MPLLLAEVLAVKTVAQAVAVADLVLVGQSQILLQQ
jgi:hypothetical protein